VALRDLKFPIILGLCLFAANQLRRWIGIEFPVWFSLLCVAAVVVASSVFVYYGRKRERLSADFLARRDNAPKFEDEARQSMINVQKETQ
jgi:hypothetical protein